ncbi:MAG: spermidine synthase, partial [Planctomycetota bacterium]
PRMVSEFENRIYQDEVIYSKTSRYQKIVLTRWRNDTRLYLNGHLQFSSVDEYRYHESLALPAMAAAESRERVLILGGGDGLLAYQVLKYKDLKQITVVDLDDTVTDLFSNNTLLRGLNHDSLLSPKVKVINQDAMDFLSKTSETFDVILLDLPDPSESALAKLYSEAFYRLCMGRLASGGTLATQATSPFKSREAFWCIEKTLDTVTRQTPAASPESFHTYPYHTYIPTFGTWGFVLASKRPIKPASVQVSVETRFLTSEALASMFSFPKDMSKVDVPVNRLNEPVLSRLYRNGYHKYLD